MVMHPPSASALGRALRAVCCLLASLAATGCTVELRMAEVRDPSRPNATIRYSAVRKETRQFPDYSAIDARILADDGAAAPPRGR